MTEVNPDDAALHEGIIANPNCSTMQLVPLLMALRDSVELERVIVDTYQSVSGTGAEAVDELEAQIEAHVAGESKVASVYPHPIAFNALPEIDVFRDDGYTKEEWKVIPRAARSCTCRTCVSRARPSGCRSSSAIRRPSTSRRADPSRPDGARELFAAVPGRRGRRRATCPPLPAGHRCRRPRRDLRRAHPCRTPSIARWPRPRVLGASPTTCGRGPPRTPSEIAGAGPSRAGWLGARASVPAPWSGPA